MGSSVLLFSCILSTLVATGSFSLSCTECEGEDEMSCKGRSNPCSPDSDSCLAIYMSTSNGGEEEKKYIKSCGERRLCSQKGSFTYADGEIKISTDCCFSSNCNPPMPELPDNNEEKNGVPCMECRSSGDVPCTSSTYRDCAGDEEQCVSLFATAGPLSNTSVSGCGTPVLCKIKEIGFDSRKLGVYFTCPSGSGSLQYSLFVLIFAPMFLVKVMG